MFFLDYGSAITDVDDVILSFDNFSLSDFVLKLGTKKSFERLN